MKKLSSMKSVLCVLGAGMLWGCMGILVRTLSAGGFSSLEVTAFRCVVTTIVMLGILVIRNPKDLKIRMRDLWCFVGTGICSVTFFNVCYFSLNFIHTLIYLLYFWDTHYYNTYI